MKYAAVAFALLLAACATPSVTIYEPVEGATGYDGMSLDRAKAECRLELSQRPGARMAADGTLRPGLYDTQFGTVADACMQAKGFRATGTKPL